MVPLSVKSLPTTNPISAFKSLFLLLLGICDITTSPNFARRTLCASIFTPTTNSRGLLLPVLILGVMLIV